MSVCFRSPNIILFVVVVLSSFSLLPVTVAFNNLQQLFKNNKAAANKRKIPAPENGVDPENYPWCFKGRLWFRPALVKTQQQPQPEDPTLSIVSFFGWTIGGVVALEYDESPVGPYREYVTMGAVVSKRGAIGQWGSNLYVSTQEAVDVCEDVWGVPAKLAGIDFINNDNSDGADTDGTLSKSLKVTSAPALGGEGKENIVVEGWENAIVSDVNSHTNRNGGVPVLWTPTIKALWAPLVPFPPSSDSESQQKLPLHKLRLSASSLRLHLCPQESSNELGIPIGIGLTVDNVLIEIGRQDSTL